MSKRPWLWLGNTTAATLLLGAADVLEQKIQHGRGKKQKIDWRRAGRVATMGLVLGPMSHHYYVWLDRTIRGATRGIVVIKKVGIDVSVAPVFSSVFVTGIALQEGHSIKEALSEYAHKFFRIFALDLCIWPPTQAVNFFYLPPQYRVLFVSVVQLVYNTAMCSIKHSNISASTAVG